MTYDVSHMTHITGHGFYACDAIAHMTCYWDYDWFTVREAVTHMGSADGFYMIVRLYVIMV